MPCQDVEGAGGYQSNQIPGGMKKTIFAQSITIMKILNEILMFGPLFFYNFGGVVINAFFTDPPAVGHCFPLPETAPKTMEFKCQGNRHQQNNK